MPKAFSSIREIEVKSNERLKYCEVTFRCKLQVSRDRRENLSIYVKHVIIKAMQIKTRRKFELRLSTSVHLLENLKQSGHLLGK